MQDFAQAKALHAIAAVAYDLNKAIDQSFEGTQPWPTFDTISDEEQLGLVQAVIHYLSNPDETPAESHDKWFEVMKAQNQPMPDHLATEYRFLPQLQRTKDEAFRQLVLSLSPLYDIFYMQALMEAEAAGKDVSEQVEASMGSAEPVKLTLVKD